MTYTTSLDPSTKSSILIKLFRNVKNVPEIRQKIMDGSLQCCAVKANLILDPIQIVVAANKAMVSEKLKTRSIYTEILFNLSISKNITQSLQTFGIHDNDCNLVLSIISGGKDDSEDVWTQIDGEEIGLEQLNEITDINAVCKVYKINDVEKKCQRLLDSVVTRIAVKDCLL